MEAEWAEEVEELLRKRVKLNDGLSACTRFESDVNLKSLFSFYLFFFCLLVFPAGLDGGRLNSWLRDVLVELRGRVQGVNSAAVNGLHRRSLMRGCS